MHSFIDVILLLKCVQGWGCLAYLDGPQYDSTVIKLYDPICICLFKVFMETRAMCVSDVNDFILVSLLLTLNRFHTLPLCFHSWLGASKCRLKKVRRCHSIWHVDVCGNGNFVNACWLILSMCEISCKKTTINRPIVWRTKGLLLVVFFVEGKAHPCHRPDLSSPPRVR